MKFIGKAVRVLAMVCCIGIVDINKCFVKKNAKAVVEGGGIRALQLVSRECTGEANGSSKLNLLSLTWVPIFIILYLAGDTIKSEEAFFVFLSGIDVLDHLKSMNGPIVYDILHAVINSLVELASHSPALEDEFKQLGVPTKYLQILKDDRTYSWEDVEKIEDMIDFVTMCHNKKLVNT